MLKKAVSILLICGLYVTSNLSIQVQAQTVNQVVQSQQTKNQETLRAKFTKSDGKTISDKTFTAADAEKLEKRSLSQNVKKNNFSTAAKVGIGVGIALAVVLVVFLVANNDSDESGPIRCGNIQAPCP